MAQFLTTAYQRTPFILSAESAASQPTMTTAPSQPLRHCVAEFGAYLQRCSTLSDLLQTAMAKIGGAIAADVVAVSQRLSNDDECLLTTVHVQGTVPEVCPRYFHWAVGLADPKSPQYLNATDLQQLPPALRQCLQLRHMDNGWIIPLHYNGQLWGHLMGFWRSPFAPRAVNIMAHLDQMAAQLMVGVKLVELQRQADYSQGQQQQLEQLLHHLQLHDPLTGLPNRKHLLQELNQALAVESASDLTGVVLVDIDRFQTINESLGHEAGDQLLLEVGFRLAQALKPTHALARWGEDTFAIVLRQLPDSDSAEAIAAKLRREIERPYDCNHTQVFLTSCMGISLSRSARTTSETLVQEADTALHQAKGQGKGQILSFRPAMHDQMVARLQLETALHKALQNQEFLLYYQPVVTLSDQKLVGFEALVRWQHPTRGMISPAEFIPLAEETGLIIAIDQWCLQTACEQMHQWQQRWPNLPPLTISVNLSSHNFSQPNLVKHIQTCLETAKVAPDRLKLEITESVLIGNTGLATAILTELQQLGLQISMDDFGTGYSSLNYLHQFKFDTLKIDQSFIALLEDGTEKMAIVQAIITLAHALGMNVVAEGVETSAQHDLLVAMHCECGQGYLFDKPLTSDDATSTIEQRIL
ncbi:MULTISPECIES: EAL domain-containing protein [Cyanophyceae]|uniref:putative bifunctional diguanylate cyclase/phosphodiesterase n=1 Tax=Cyanophyceae TaxID=3028117 RepID=UPI0016826B74|nr:MULTISPECIES: EAL domain-containing protein [Cyanophyceae]MBD1914592.1 EAL domain-containing protein [Phormidium sp. FACHB-77]MBD2030316.1 EAL domain-containing protein [Phormidium sp. FACHB-322]MBD2049861.1 EAL domain-containing protein [Leptolyngbya sp. FACHB-60]